VLATTEKLAATLPAFVASTLCLTLAREDTPTVVLKGLTFARKPISKPCVLNERTFFDFVFAYKLIFASFAIFGSLEGDIILQRWELNIVTKV
jgi:hypothetical protein